MSPDAPDPPDADDLRAEVAAALGTDYSVERELGGGGMSRVFVVRDRALGREVVVKVLAPELALGISAERFAREIRLAAALQEPHVVPVLSAGVTARGLPYYSMPFVRGESLRHRLTSGQVPQKEALSILRDIATALDYAHGRGVVHRDIKPENVLLSGRTAVVADFGIARALTSAKGDGRHEFTGNVTERTSPLTGLGVSLGTPAYMAPEQAVGESVDERADLYAWGVIAYELLAGNHPFAGKIGAQQLIAAHIAERPVPINEVRPGLPPFVAAIVTRCLEKDRADRPGSAAAVLEALDSPVAPLEESVVGVRAVARRRVGLLAVGIVAAAICVGLVVQRQRLATLLGASRRAVSAEPVSDSAGGAAIRLAVLPFENLGRPEDAYFADGMADEVRGKLAALANLLVIARSSSAQYRTSQHPVALITRELGVQFLLTATVRWARDPAHPSRVQVRPELVQLVDGRPVTRWQQSFDAVVTDVFDVQAQIAERVAQALDIELAAKERSRLTEPPTRVLAAYDAFLRGEQAWAGTTTPTQVIGAIQEFQRAITLDSNFVAAWVRLVQMQSILLGNAPARARRAGISPLVARRTAEHTSTLAGNRAEGHVALGYYYGLVETDNIRALEHFTLGLRGAPNNTDLLSATAFAEIALGRWDDALVPAKRAALLNPRSAADARLVGFILLALRRYAEARDAFTRARVIQPSDPLTVVYLGMIAIAQGDTAQARSVYRNAITSMDSVALAVSAASQNVLWSLDDSLRGVLERVGPDSFGGDRAVWALTHAQVAALREDVVRSRAWADSARIAADEAIATAPDDAPMHAVRGLALAYLARPADAIREGKRAVELWPISKDVGGYLEMQHQLMRIYLLVGDHEAALDALDVLLRQPYYLSPQWLRVDPTFAPLRGNPRFERLAPKGN